MLLRYPVAAGRFYPDAPQTLLAEVRHWLAYEFSSDAATAPGHNATTGGIMLPHAGYVYCGAVIGATLASTRATWVSHASSQAKSPLPQRLLLLCPNHTGMGHPLGIWPEGAWRTPLGDVPVDAELAQALLAGKAGFAADTAAHMHEHAIEVLLPFLQCPSRPLRVTPVCIGTSTAPALRRAGEFLAEVIQQCEAEGEPVGIIVSSDMNHYEDQETTLRKDNLALAAICACDAQGLLDVTRREQITMCGAAPMALALFAMQSLGKPWATLCAHDTSASASGDLRHVVGYAGVRFGWEPMS
ncbi:MAG: AmmeMemoRadiSam system protein B [Desulfovibrio sp.]|nr:AmmeMemoRadiSam system protein B [Desulfovibrio sp.]